MVMLRWLLASQPASNFVLFSGGSTTAGTRPAISSSEKYLIDSDSVISATSLGTARHSAGSSFIGNRTSSFVLGGLQDFSTAPYSTAETYVFANNTYSSASSITTARSRYAASSALEFGLIATGDNAAFTAYVLTSEKYTFSSQSSSSGTSLTGTARISAGGAGNLTLGLFTGGLTAANIAQTTSNKYTYSTDVVSSGTALSTGRYNHTATSTPSIAYFGGGTLLSTQTANVDKYTFASDSISSGTNLSGSARQVLASSGNAYKGIFAGGLNSSGVYVNQVSVYTYNGDTVAAGTVLATARALHGGICSYPGHL